MIWATPLHRRNWGLRAGGERGVAIGSNASGGQGGPGRHIITLNGTAGGQPLVRVVVEREGTVAGEGGGGGECVSATLGPDDLAGVHHFDFQMWSLGSRLALRAGDTLSALRARGSLWPWVTLWPWFLSRPLRS